MDYRAALECAVEAAREAGAHLLAEARRPEGPRGWGAHADADIEADSLIHARFSRYFPEWGYLGEELGLMKPAGPDEHLWLVDPNDATSAFLRGLRGPSVSIALLRGAVPVLGVVFAYTAPDDAGDFMAWAEGCGSLLRNGCTVTRAWPLAAGAENVALVGVKPSAADLERWQGIAHPVRLRECPSIAYRLALVAAGEAELAISTTRLKSWDIAAGHAMVLGCGGTVVGGDGVEIRYLADGTCDTKNRVLGGSPVLVSYLKGRWKGGGH